MLVVLVAQMDELLLELVLDLAKGLDGGVFGRVGLAEIAGFFGGLAVLVYVGR